MKRDYDLLTELCDNQETFDKFRDWMKQEKEEKIKKLWKELLKLDPELEITPRKNDKREQNTNTGSVRKANTTLQKTNTVTLYRIFKRILQGSE